MWPVVAGKVDLGDIVIPKEVTTVLRFIGGVEIEIENICVVKDSHCSQRSSKVSKLAINSTTCNIMSVGTPGPFVTAQVVELEHSDGINGGSGCTDRQLCNRKITHILLWVSVRNFQK